MFNFILLTLVSINQFAPVEKPDLLVAGPTEASVGDKIVFVARSENAKTFDFTVIYNGEYDELAYEVIGDRYCVTQSKPGKYIVIVKAVNEAGDITSSIQRLTVVGQVEPPKPITIPDGFKGLTKWTYEEKTSATMPVGVRAKLAENMLASKNSTATSVNEFILETKNKNRATFTEADLKLLEPFNAVLNAKLTEMFKASDISSVEDHKKAYQAIAEGLLYVK